VQWEFPEIVAAFNQDVEGAELDLLVMLAGMQCIDVGDAFHTEDYGLAVEDEARLPDLASGLHDPGSLRCTNSISIFLRPGLC
jgi:hypothetical protein